jgi:hypothetical protein
MKIHVNLPDAVMFGGAVWSAWVHNAPLMSFFSILGVVFLFLPGSRKAPGT